MDNDLYEKIIVAILLIALLISSKSMVLNVHNDSLIAQNHQQFSVFSLTINRNQF
jgi:hypothetical protein